MQFSCVEDIFTSRNSTPITKPLSMFTRYWFKECNSVVFVECWVLKLTMVFPAAIRSLLETLSVSYLTSVQEISLLELDICELGVMWLNGLISPLAKIIISYSFAPIVENYLLNSSAMFLSPVTFKCGFYFVNYLRFWPTTIEKIVNCFQGC